MPNYTYLFRTNLIKLSETIFSRNSSEIQSHLYAEFSDMRLELHHSRQNIRTTFKKNSQPPAKLANNFATKHLSSGITPQQLQLVKVGVGCTCAVARRCENVVLSQRVHYKWMLNQWPVLRNYLYSWFLCVFKLYVVRVLHVRVRISLPYLTHRLAELFASEEMLRVGTLVTSHQVQTNVLIGLSMNFARL